MDSFIKSKSIIYVEQQIICILTNILIMGKFIQSQSIIYVKHEITWGQLVCIWCFSAWHLKAIMWNLMLASLSGGKVQRANIGKYYIRENKKVVKKYFHNFSKYWLFIPTPINILYWILSWFWTYHVRNMGHFKLPILNVSIVRKSA